MGRWGDEQGQAIVEYLGVVLLVAVLLLALSTLDVGPQTADALASSVCGVAGLASCEPDVSPPDRRALVDRYASGDLDDFLRYRHSADRDPRLDWSTDYCSAPVLGSRGLGYDFAEACLRHDFAYRNYRALGLLPRLRARADGVFLRDMRASCATRNPLLRPRCQRRALQYYAGVRAFGGKLRRYVG